MTPTSQLIAFMSTQDNKAEIIIDQSQDHGIHYKGWIKQEEFQNQLDAEEHAAKDAEMESDVSDMAGQACRLFSYFLLVSLLQKHTIRKKTFYHEFRILFERKRARTGEL